MMLIARLYLVTAVALGAPLLFYLIQGATQSNGAYDAPLVLLNWGIVVSPQLLVLLLAWMSRFVRARLVRTLVALTVLVLLFQLIVLLGDANSPMLWAIYFPLAGVCIIASCVIPSTSTKASGSNNRIERAREG